MKRVVLITGVAGGIGSATASVFADAGWHVVGVDCRGVDTPYGVAHFIQSDVSGPESPKYIVERLQARENRLDALINNAAVQICKPLLQTTIDDWDVTMKTNVRSAFLCVREAYELLKRNRGAIVNVGSVHAFATSVRLAAYVASKGALLALTRAMALEFGSDGIRVNAVLPGAVNTPMLHKGLSRGCIDGANDLDGLLGQIGKKHVLGRVGLPEEIAQAILFLADNEHSSFVTGQSLIVDGGATARLSTE